MPSASLTGVLLAAGAMLLFAAGTLITSVAARRLDTDAGALVAVTMNVLFGCAILLAEQWVHPAAWTFDPLGVLGFVLAGLFSTYLGRWLFFRAVVTLGPTRASTFQTGSPLVTAVLGWLLLSEQLSMAAMIGIATTVAGLVVMGAPAKAAGAAGRSVGAGKPDRADRSDRADRPIETIGPSPAARMTLRGALVLGVGSSAAYAVSNLLRAAAVRSWNEPVAGAVLGAVAGLVVYLLIHRRRLAALAARMASNRGAVALFCTVGAMQVTAQICTIASMRYIPASVAALITMCTPLVVLPVSVVAFRNAEAVQRRTVVGIAFALLGVAVVVLR